jgi:hypothetical protein
MQEGSREGARTPGVLLLEKYQVGCGGSKEKQAIGSTTSFSPA